ncbi:MAG: hypothetical protein ABIK65_12695 [Candidatus Eisenbacteria bacterium]
MRAIALIPFLGLLLPTALFAQIDVGSDGSDGAYNPLSNDTIDLSLAPTADWTTAGSGDGVYDSTEWAVVFKFSSVNIPAGVNVRFINHPSGAPVVWLVDGTVTIDGNVYLDGQDGTGTGYTPSEGGPGGFRGGRAYSSTSSPGGAGLGPGGGLYPNGAGSYGTQGGGNGPLSPTYGNARVLPLIGGSGGGATTNSAGYGGGAGGGAILIAADESILISGMVSANGGVGNNYIASVGGSGSGGGIRLISDMITSNGTIRAAGGVNSRPGGAGRIRVEGNTVTVNPTNPNFTVLTPLGVDDPVIWAPADAPTLVVVTINGESVPVDPNGEFTTPPGDVNLAALGPVDVVVNATNVPIASTVKVRLIPKSGIDLNVVASYTSGDDLASTWTATLDSLPRSGFAAVQARAELP